MDGRGRLAQSLTRLAPWRARASAKPPPAAWARGRARVRLPWWLLRPMWRVLRPVLQAQPPRGAGAAAAALIMLASVAYGVVRGDHVATIVEALKDLRDSAANAAGFRIVALFDTDPAKIGHQVDGLEIHGMADLPSILRRTGADLGLLTVPSEAAQSVADALVAAGIRGVLNFAPGILRLPPGVSLVSVDLTVQLEQLAFLVQLGGSD